MRRIEKVEAAPGYRLHLTWRDGQSDTIDMTGVIHGMPLFAPLRDQLAFSSVRVATYGSGIEWGDGNLDYSADSLEHLADEQRVRLKAVS